MTTTSGKIMRVLTPDDKRAQQIVREMEARGFELTNVNTSGAHDMTAREVFTQFKDEKREALAQSKKVKRSQRWKRFGNFVSFLIMLVVVWIITR